MTTARNGRCASAGGGRRRGGGLPPSGATIQRPSLRRRLPWHRPRHQRSSRTTVAMMTAARAADVVAVAAAATPAPAAPAPAARAPAVRAPAARAPATRAATTTRPMSQDRTGTQVPASCTFPERLTDELSGEGRGQSAGGSGRGPEEWTEVHGRRFHRQRVTGVSSSGLLAAGHRARCACRRATARRSARAARAGADGYARASRLRRRSARSA